MSDVDGLLERIRNWMNCGREWTDGLSEAWNIMSASLATIEHQREEIERLRSQLSPRCSIPADIDLDDVIVRFTNRTDEPC